MSKNESDLQEPWLNIYNSADDYLDKIREEYAQEKDDVGLDQRCKMGTIEEMDKIVAELPSNKNEILPFEPKIALDQKHLAEIIFKQEGYKIVTELLVSSELEMASLKRLLIFAVKEKSTMDWTAHHPRLIAEINMSYNQSYVEFHSNKGVKQPRRNFAKAIRELENFLSE